MIIFYDCALCKVVFKNEIKECPFCGNLNVFKWKFKDEKQFEELSKIMTPMPAHVVNAYNEACEGKNE